MIVDDARRIEAKLFAAKLYQPYAVDKKTSRSLYKVDQIKMKMTILRETRYYAASRNKHKEEQNRIRRSISRLLLFIHVKNCKDKVCKNPDYRKLCPQFKELFNHTMSCKNPDCKVDHCTSSKYIIAHWTRCKNKKSCLTCGNVLATLQKQHDAVLQRRHQQPRKPTYTHDLLRVFSQTQFRKHFQAIRNECNVFYTKDLLELHFLPLIKKIEDKEYGWIFAQPVDTTANDIAHYSKIVKRPMDLSKVKTRLANHKYTSKPPSGELRADLVSIFENAILFNKPNHLVHKVAQEYVAIVTDEFDRVTSNLIEKEAKQRMDPDHCALCGGGAIMLEPVMLWCKECGAKIQRKANFYVSEMAANTQTCEPCYKRMHNKELKATLQKRVHNQTPQEDWIECDRCKRWFHEICGLFNTSKVRKNHTHIAGAAAKSVSAPVSARSTTGNSSRVSPSMRNGRTKDQKEANNRVRTQQSSASSAVVQANQPVPANSAAIVFPQQPTINENHQVKYTCPLCIYEDRCRLGTEHPTTSEEYRGAGFLPANKMTHDIEMRINRFLLKHMRARQRTQGDNYHPNQFARVKVRCVSNLERCISEATTKKSALLFEWLRQQNNYHMKFKGRSKMILLFQEVDGVDIVFFAMYVDRHAVNVL